MKSILYRIALFVAMACLGLSAHATYEIKHKYTDQTITEDTDQDFSVVTTQSIFVREGSAATDRDLEYGTQRFYVKVPKGMYADFYVNCKGHTEGAGKGNFSGIKYKVCRDKDDGVDKTEDQAYSWKCEADTDFAIYAHYANGAAKSELSMDLHVNVTYHLLVLPDLTVQNVSLSSTSVDRADDLTVSFNLVNGDRRFASDVRMVVVDLGTESILGETKVGWISASQTISGSISVRTGPLSPGTHRLVVRADPDNSIKELDESNNDSAACSLSVASGGTLSVSFHINGRGASLDKAQWITYDLGTTYDSKTLPSEVRARQKIAGWETADGTAVSLSDYVRRSASDLYAIWVSTEPTYVDVAFYSVTLGRTQYLETRTFEVGVAYGSFPSVNHRVTSQHVEWYSNSGGTGSEVLPRHYATSNITVLYAFVKDGYRSDEGGSGGDTGGGDTGGGDSGGGDTGGGDTGGGDSGGGDTGGGDTGGGDSGGGSGGGTTEDNVLTGITVQQEGSAVRLNWSCANQYECVYIYRASNALWENASYVNWVCAINTFLDDDVAAGKTYWYWLEYRRNGVDKQIGPYAITISSDGYIAFSAGAGSGAMPTVRCPYGKVCKLPTCTFAAPSGMRFAGWYCSNGRRYDDGVLVYNLAQPGETVTMTAIWE